MEYYEKDGKVAALVSPGFGAGWSTWNQKELAYDKRVVELFLKYGHCLNHCSTLSELEYEESSSDLAKKIAKEIAGFGYRQPHMSGFWSCEIVWVPKGKPFIIKEYDGHEELVSLDDLGVICF